MRYPLNMRRERREDILIVGLSASLEVCSFYSKERILLKPQSILAWVKLHVTFMHVLETFDRDIYSSQALRTECQSQS